MAYRKITDTDTLPDRFQKTVSLADADPQCIQPRLFRTPQKRLINTDTHLIRIDIRRSKAFRRDRLVFTHPALDIL